MKRCLIISMLVSLALCRTACCDTMNDLNRFKTLIQAIVEKRGKLIRSQFGQAEIAGLLRTTPEYTELVQELPKASLPAINNLHIIAPDRVSRIILLHAAEGLNGEDYLKFISKAQALAFSGDIQKDEFLQIVVMSPTKKRWFLSYNYTNPAVMDFLGQVGAQYSDDPEIRNLVDFILSGRARDRDEILRRENRALSSERVDILPPSSLSEPQQGFAIAEPLPGSGHHRQPSPFASPVPIVSKLKFGVIHLYIVLIALVAATIVAISLHVRRK